MRTSRPRSVLAVAAITLLTASACSSAGSDAGKATTSTTGAAGATRITTDRGGQTGEPLARYADYRTKNYDDPSHWVCRPQDGNEICHSDLDATSIAADGKLTVEKFQRASDPAIDCFYVYPTISRDQTTYSDWKFSPNEEGYVTKQQAARLGEQCRVFAPVYRQTTLAGLAGALGGKAPAGEKGDPFADVLDAFRTYMATQNRGRGVVLIGHSQGAGMLNQLIKTEIDPHADVRAKLVGAYLAGGAVAVPKGKVVGGDFAHVPLCTSSDEAGCVVTWATFRSTAPPPTNSFFGKPRGAAASDVAGCVNPADPAGGKDVEVRSYFPTNTGASILTGEGGSSTSSGWVDPSAGKITTPFVTVPGLVTEQCASSNGFTYLKATVHPDPKDPRADDIGGDLTPQWGLHLVDVNLVMGNIVDLVGEQAKAYAR
ncbi:MAG: DUF3089 domain-containing protein [Acidimicrobiales bacterium]